VGRESERLVEVAGLFGNRINSAIKDVIPPEAQVHLLNAQRELLTALFLIYEHQVGARRPAPAKPVRRRASSARSRATRIQVD
jgi:hypothetical protein